MNVSMLLTSNWPYSTGSKYFYAVLLQVFSIPRTGHAGMGIPIGICLLPNGKFVVSSKRAGSAVKMYNQDDGKFLKELTCNRSDFDQPSDMATLKNGDFAIRDESKVMIFNGSGNFLRTVWESKGVLRSYGLAVDKNNKLVCMIEGRLSAYLQFCDPEDPKKRLQSIDLENVIGLNKRRSSCRFLTYKNDKFYVTDLGRDKVYVVNAENGDVKESVKHILSSLVGKLFGRPKSGILENVTFSTLPS